MLCAAGDILIACKTPVYVCAVPENMRLIKITAAKNDSACVLGPRLVAHIILKRDKSRNEKAKTGREYLQLASPPFLFVLSGVMNEGRSKKIPCFEKFSFCIHYAYRLG
jgi:hypothetical protein